MKDSIIMIELAERIAIANCFSFLLVSKRLCKNNRNLIYLRVVDINVWMWFMCISSLSLQLQLLEPHYLFLEKVLWSSRTHLQGVKYRSNLTCVRLFAECWSFYSQFIKAWNMENWYLKVLNIYISMSYTCEVFLDI